LVLAVDTTSARGSVALVEGSSLRGEEQLSDSDKPSLHLLPAIERVLAASGTSPSAVEGFAVTVGPGSFTGLRVGLSTVQGLALASGRPCLGVCVLDVLAEAARGAVTFALTDAYRGEVYWGQYDALCVPVGPPRAGPLADALEVAPEGACFVGDAAVSHQAVVAARVPGARFPEFPPYLAASLGRFAEPRLREGKGGGPEALRPLYVRSVAIRGSLA
jgi:tRNA threonylcarbamoyladenosine biosynthesis protein TsaB